MEELTAKEREYLQEQVDRMFKNLWEMTKNDVLGRIKKIEAWIEKHDADRKMMEEEEKNAKSR